MELILYYVLFVYVLSYLSNTSIALRMLVKLAIVTGPYINIRWNTEFSPL